MSTEYGDDEAAVEENPFEDLGDDAVANLIRESTKALNRVLAEASRREIRVQIRHDYTNSEDAARKGRAPAFSFEVVRIAVDRPL